MIAIFKKEVIHFFGSLTGLITIGVFLVVLGLIMWVLPDYSILQSQYATMDQLFSIAPVVFIFLVPAITMRTFAEEHASGNFEMLSTKPLTLIEIVTGKYLATLFLVVVVAIVPTVIYYYSLYQLGSPKGNIDSGEIAASYLALVLLSASFCAIGVFASSLTRNQIVAFLLGSFLCFFFHWTFFYLSRLEVFFGRWDDVVQKIGIDYHYLSMSRGVLDTRDLVYFISFSAIFLLATVLSISRRS
ncbi:MAG: ABC transporter permease [Saprospiraceae bacterium]|nr:ABC transporter permease [Saprospiraceae bacterium]